ncbi:MAG TPA: nuclear transport factor 2 family protein [Candidatus Acidoferrum sp.]|nr:nuclear transport factor 2 family protein [Candidatus Acidoferrum sp.]
MPKFSPRRLAQRSYEAFAAGDRKFFEQHLAEDFTFSSPLDVGLDRAGYFARCWPGAGHGQKFNFLRLIEHDDEVVVTYEMTKPNGEKGRNTEILRIKDNKIISVEVYFGWDVSSDTFDHEKGSHK